jgi:hypothetical protein
MRIWNLSTLSDLEKPVVLKFQRRPTRKRTPTSSSRIKAGFTIAAAAVGLSAAIQLQYPNVSAPTVSVSRSESNIAQSLPRTGPPLADLFASTGTLSQEESAGLKAMVALHDKKPIRHEDSELLDVVQGNLHEEFGDASQVDQRQLLKVIKGRRSV